MSITVTGTGPRGPARRVRQQAREVVALMAFSATTSVALAGLAVLLLQLGRQG